MVSDWHGQRGLTWRDEAMSPSGIQSLGLQSSFHREKEKHKDEVAGSSKETKRKLVPSHSHWRMSKTFRQHGFYVCWSSVFTVQINPIYLTNPRAEGQASNPVPFSESFWNSATQVSMKDSFELENILTQHSQCCFWQQESAIPTYMRHHTVSLIWKIRALQTLTNQSNTRREKSTLRGWFIVLITYNGRAGLIQQNSIRLIDRKVAKCGESYLLLHFSCFPLGIALQAWQKLQRTSTLSLLSPAPLQSNTKAALKEGTCNRVHSMLCLQQTASVQPGVHLNLAALGCLVALNI